ncbi:peroxiredoxin [Algicola sagamiensis]|uniref:peroxiredoxin n=1 Tax=Algicola sagamiensis TaxID=163869 RepID=UPI00036F6F32|nr:peroxiredoxin [Algicola sagamiensis]
MIQVGDRIPEATLSYRENGDTKTITTQALTEGKTVVLFAVPGAFTPTCSAAHLPGYVVFHPKFIEKGVDHIACISVNDAFVMSAWGESQNAEEIMMLADGDASMTKALGVESDTGNFGGIRSQRYAMIIKDGIVTHFNLEKPKTFEVSDAESMLALL